DAREFLFELTQKVKLADRVIGKFAFLLSSFDRALPLRFPCACSMNGLIKCQEQERYGAAKNQRLASCVYFHRRVRRMTKGGECAAASMQSFRLRCCYFLIISFKSLFT